jgi:hypothetical protein
LRLSVVRLAGNVGGAMHGIHVAAILATAIAVLGDINEKMPGTGI